MPPEDLEVQESSATIPPELILYIKHLEDRPTNYQRFFDALLVKRPDHKTFFQDLRHFREQEHITNLLITPEVDGLSSKELYRECTRQFLASRFAHPWCRNEYGTTKSGFLNTAKGKQKQIEARRMADERLHKLLVPIWIPFRRRMMPTEEEMAQFLAEFDVKEADRRRGLEEQQQADRARAKEAGMSAKLSETDPELDQRPPIFNAEAFVAEEDDLDHAPDQRNQGAQQAAHLFVGVAAAAFLASNKRARKYVMRKMKK